MNVLLQVRTVVEIPDPDDPDGWNTDVVQASTVPPDTPGERFTGLYVGTDTMLPMHVDDTIDPAHLDQQLDIIRRVLVLLGHTVEIVRD